MPELEVGSPLWWVRRLNKRLLDRQKSIKRHDDYYGGEHSLAFASAKFRAAFGGLFEEFADNWCGLVVDAVEERLNIKGFRLGGEARGDQEAWRIWQENQMDAGAVLAHTEALVTGEASILVWINEATDRPLITVEHPSQMFVEFTPGTNRRAAAFKRWRDDWTGRVMGTLYLPEAIYKYQSRTVSRVEFAASVNWDAREVDNEPWPLPNPLGVVPVVPLLNRPRLLKPPESEIKQIVPIQDAVNKLIADMMVASEYTAMKRRWATGLEIPRDPVTGEEKPFPFEQLMSHMLTVEDEDVKFGEFSATDLSNFVQPIEMFVQHAASQSRTPPHYFYLIKGNQPSGESIKSAETGLVAKAGRKMIHWGEAHEEVIRLAFGVLDNPRRDAPEAETIWADPESRTESQHIDSVVKRKELEVPREQLWEDAGYSEVQIARFKKMLAEIEDEEEEPEGEPDDDGSDSE